MSFNMAAYQNVANTERDVREAKQTAMAKAGEKQAETQEFKVDKVQEFKDQAEKASKRFGLGRLGGMIVGLGLTALTGGAAAPLIMAASAGVGGAIGKGQAKKALKSDYFKRSQDNIKTTMTKGIIGDTIMGALMGGVAGGGMKAGSTFGQNLVAGGKALVKPGNMGGVMGTKSLFDQVIGNDSTVEEDALQGTSGNY